MGYASSHNGLSIWKYDSLSGMASFLSAKKGTFLDFIDRLLQFYFMCQLSKCFLGSVCGFFSVFFYFICGNTMMCLSCFTVKTNVHNVQVNVLQMNAIFNYVFIKESQKTFSAFLMNFNTF